MSEADIPTSTSHGPNVDAFIDAVAASRGGEPSRLSAPPQLQRQPNMRVNTATGEVEFATPEDAELAAQLAAQEDGDIRDNVNLDATYRQLLAELQREQERLNEHRFDPATGGKVYAVEGAAREALQRRVDQLGQEAVWTLERYGKAKAARQAKAELAQRQLAAEALAEEWINGDASRREALRQALKNYEAGAIAEVVTRMKLGQV